MLTTEIKSKIQSLWDRLWAGGLANPITAIEQISFLLFMRRLENINEGVLIKDNDKLKWSKFKELEGSELVDRVKNEVFEFIKHDLSKEDEPFSKAMRDATFSINNPLLLKEAINYIEEIYVEIEKQENKHQHFQDIQGDVYEYLLKQTNEAGKNGQFRTPRHIIQMMTELLDPKIDGKICDLTSGSSGFLVGAFQYLLKENSSFKEIDENGLEKGLDGDLLSKNDLKDLNEDTFYGFDIDQTMVRIGTMNLIMHGITKPNIKYINSLSDEYENEFQEFIVEKDEFIPKLKYPIDRVGEGEFKYVLANPPFSGKLNSERVSKTLNRIYDLKSKSRQTELLFLERIVYMLELEGKAAVIVPEGVLFNASKAYKKTREIILKDCKLEAVISLPSGVFQPYTGVKTSILLFTKKQFLSDEYNTEKVWFYGMESDGYSLDSNRKRIKNDNSLIKSIEIFKKRNNSKQEDRKFKHFFVPIQDIVDNGYELNYNLYKEFEYEEEKYEPPIKLLKKLRELENDISDGINNLIEDIK
ncbi:class I SAM-dependent DNA methyltransferase [Winogradskyella bathintestinalis]|uniref:site-specific DNA-methyltransferase (adenine-specific) n=1 Tax=Winogradskyella bathintestinalis TaxID=3035208 RepID=A0ABT7ZXR3_9FLAO|nr:N-6 DNA methylase [Winogradskyella bathintestinalis]MDN3493791.1 N-6 DNA methylase [Winogradskyella bathintestinalis]